MALEPYRARVAPGGTAQLGQASGDAFGVGLGRALGDLGGELYSQAKAAERNEQNAAFSVQLENLKAETDQYELAMKVGEVPTAAPGGAGHAAVVEQYWNERAEKLLGGITDDRLRSVAEVRVAEFRRHLVQGATTYEASARIKKLGEDSKTALTAAANRVRFTDDPAKLGEAIDSFHLQAEGYAVPPDMRAGMIAEGEATIKGSFLQGQIDRNPAVARALIERGAFDDLPPNVLDSALSAIDVQERRLQAEADAQARLAKAEAKQEVDAFLQAGRDGVPQSREEIARIKGLVQAHGLAGDVYDVDKIETENNVRMVTRPMLPAQIAAELNSVEARIATAGDKANPRDIWMRDELRTELGKRRAQIDSDPYSYAATNGIPVAPLDLADAASVQQRLRVNRTLAEATGRPVPLLQKDEVGQLAAQASGGPQQRGALAEALGRFGGPEALRAARQIAPKDWTLQQAIALPPALRTAVFEGEKMRAGNPKLAPVGDIRDRFEERAARALRELPASYRNGVIATATNIYAYRASRAGATDFDEYLFDAALADAIDSTGKGGIGEWRGKPVKLPYGMSQDDFDKRLSRFDQLNGAFHADKSPISASELRRRFTPVASPDPGLYWFQDDRGGFALDRNGNRAALKLGGD